MWPERGGAARLMTRTIMTQRAPAPMTPVHKTRWDGPGLGEFIAMMAALMAVNALAIDSMLPALPAIGDALNVSRSEEHTSELQSLMRISYAVFCLQKKK